MIDVHAVAGAKAGDVLSPGERLQIEVIGTNAGADAQAAVGAGNVEEAFALGRTETHVLDRGSLLGREVRGLSTCNGSECGGGTRHQASKGHHGSRSKLAFTMMKDWASR